MAKNGDSLSGAPWTRVQRALFPVLTATIAILSALGLLCRRIDDYDDSALLMGARMLRAGFQPYADFYTHYGPFGYSLQAVFSGAFHNPALALRLGQASLFCLLAFVAMGLTRSLGAFPGGQLAAAMSLLVLSASTLFASFYGFGLSALAVAAFGAAITDRRRRAIAWAAGGGLALAGALLTRPVFGIYAGVAIGVVSLTAVDSASRGRQQAFWLTTGCCLVLLWILLYRRVPLDGALQATLIFPARLMSAGGRYHEGSFLRAPLLLAMAFAALAAAAQLAWAAAMPRWRPRILAGAGVGVASFAPVFLRASRQPALDVTLVSVAVLLAAVSIVVLERITLRQDGLLRAAALFGVTSAAFGHYFWSRQDRPHWIPAFTLGVVAAAMAAGRLQPRRRWIVAGLFLANVLVFAPPPGLLPVEALWSGGFAKVVHNLRAARGSGESVWPCTEVPVDAVAAVVAADRNAEPGTRFVALASSQASTTQNPILLFLLSTRLPYTRWYAYDPGVQSSLSVQEEMIRELEMSRSATAVVWPSREFEEAGPQAGVLAPTRLDQVFQRTFPVAVRHYGSYELRLRNP